MPEDDQYDRNMQYVLTECIYQHSMQPQSRPTSQAAISCTANYTCHPTTGHYIARALDSTFKPHKLMSLTKVGRS